jgi:hypothetical protein
MDQQRYVCSFARFARLAASEVVNASPQPVTVVTRDTSKNGQLPSTFRALVT